MTPSKDETAPATAESISIERWSAQSGSDRPSRANLILRGGGHRWRAHADGNGAVDALMRAVDSALEPLLGAGVVLATYDVHATGPGHETKASISVSVRGRDDAILLTADGHVAEASAANVFVVNGAEVATPPLVDDILPGITRGAVM
ncbi:MAG: aminotransferase class IV, partial [Chloroflexi bacterium]|nr:aminotransferase class IV [Chloroflexota bacterium]